MKGRLNHVGFSRRVRLEWLERTAHLALAGKEKSSIQKTLTEMLINRLSANRILSKNGSGYMRGTREKVITILMKIWVCPSLFRITDITSNKIHWDDLPYCECDVPTLKKYGMNSGDILFARTGSFGATILIDEVPNPAVFSSYLIRVRLCPGTALPEYVDAAFKAPICQSQIVYRGAAQKNINARRIKQILTPLPPLDERRRIVAHLEAVQEKLRALKAAQAEMDEALKRVEQAILDKAFREEL